MVNGYFNDKPAHGFQQKRESKPKQLYWGFYIKLYNYQLFSE